MEELKYNERLKIGIFSAVGTTIEYYDFFLYALLSVLVFPKIFFPPGFKYLTAVLISLSTYFVTFMARPIGAMLFGNLGDKEGRRKGLVLNMALVGVSYIIIGLLPTYEVLGFTSVLLLIVLRLLFGLGMGGEYGGALAIVLECNWQSKNRGLWSCFVQAGPSLGELLALLGLLVFYDNLLLGWRVLVILGGIIALVNFIIRKNISESPAFLKLLRLNRIDRSPIVTTVKKYYRQILISSAMVGLAAGATTVIATYALPIMRSEGVPLNVGIMYLVIGDLVWLASLFPLTLIGDRTNREELIMLLSIVLGAILFLPGIYLLFTDKDLLLSIVLLKLTTISWAQYGLLNALNFPVEVRYTGSGFSYQLGAMYAGGLSPLLSSYFVINRELVGVYSIILGYAIISAIGVMVYMKKRQMLNYKEAS
ncbi:MAG: MFS transporter [Sulfolobaceae archaeon]|nr:MFS transporter [Sulfolobaceae archaeon]